jgi:hypothetical protein
MVQSAAPTESPYAPVNEGSRIGVVSYRNEGISAVRKRRREDAYKQMYKSCNGPYRIVAEGPRSDGAKVTTDYDGTAHVSDEQRWYIQYRCGAASDSTVGK